MFIYGITRPRRDMPSIGGDAPLGQGAAILWRFALMTCEITILIYGIATRRQLPSTLSTQPRRKPILRAPSTPTPPAVLQRHANSCPSPLSAS